MNKADRLKLRNQFLILEKIDQEREDIWEKKKEVAEEGFALHYSGELAAEDLYSGIADNEVSEDDCSLVLEVMDLYSTLQQSYESLEGGGNINKERIKFRGFDGNDPHEGRLLSYAKFVSNKLNRFGQLECKDGDFNSHGLAGGYDKYKRQIEFWESMDDKYELASDEIEEILSA